MERIQRVAARVLPVSPDGEVLMLQDQDPAEPGVLRWGTIGGATDPGESLVDAAIRELFEETGIEARWWTPGDLERAGGMVDDALHAIMDEAIRTVLGDDG